MAFIAHQRQLQRTCFPGCQPRPQQASGATSEHRGGKEMFPAKHAALLFGSALLLTPALARDDGRYDHSPLKSWFESLQSEFGKCCTDADGYIVSDADWESSRG